MYKNGKNYFVKYHILAYVDMCILAFLLIKLSLAQCSTAVHWAHKKYTVVFKISHAYKVKKTFMFNNKKKFTTNKTKNHYDSIVRHFKNSQVFLSSSLRRYTNEKRLTIAQGPEA